MKTLMLLRHAKSDWGSGLKSDHERPLNARGERDAPAMGAFMREHNLIPDEIFCSTAERTRQTAHLLTGDWPESPQVHYRDALYGASERTLLRVTAEADEDLARILLIAHNPGLHGLALDLIGEVSEGVPLRELEGNLPTAALAVFTFDVSRWQDIAPHTGRLVCYQFPKGL